MFASARYPKKQTYVSATVEGNFRILWQLSTGACLSRVFLAFQAIGLKRFSFALSKKFTKLEFISTISRWPPSYFDQDGGHRRRKGRPVPTSAGPPFDASEHCCLKAKHLLSSWSRSSFWDGFKGKPKGKPPSYEGPLRYVEPNPVERREINKPTHQMCWYDKMSGTPPPPKKKAANHCLHRNFPLLYAHRFFHGASGFRGTPFGLAWETAHFGGIRSVLRHTK